MKFPIGVIINSFRTDIPTAVKKAAKVGAQGIQVYATSGEMSPEELVGSKRADFRKLVEDNGLVISALCGDRGGGFGRSEATPRVPRPRRRARRSSTHSVRPASQSTSTLQTLLWSRATTPQRRSITCATT